MLAAAPAAQSVGSRQGEPLPFLFSTFVGGNAADWPHAIATDPNGSVYVTGYTLSFDFPTTDGAYQRVTRGNEEVYVLKLSPDGSELEWATLVGGSGLDIAWDLAIGPGGRVLVTGYTTSSDFPTTLGAYSRTREGTTDAFVLCLAPDGGSLVYSTLLGGEGPDQGYSVVALADGRCYVSGHTESLFFPTTNGVHDRALGGFSDAFLARLSADGSSLQASTYLGGSYTEWEPALARDPGGNLWLAGSTTSEGFPTTSGLPNDWSLGRDTFVAKVTPDLSTVALAAVAGKEGNDVPRSIDVGPGGRVLVAGFTSSFSFPESGGGPGNENAGGTDGYVMEFSSDLTQLLGHRLDGGARFDVAREARYGEGGRVHVLGYTNSSDFPTTLGSYKTYKSGDDHDMFYMELDGEGALAPLNVTYVGRSQGDFGMALALDRWGVPVLAGHTRSLDFPTAGDPYDDANAGGGDIVVIRFTTDEDPPVFFNDTTPSHVDTGTHLNLSVEVTDATAVGDVWVSIKQRHLDFTSMETVVMWADGRYRASVYVGPDVVEVEYHFMAWDVLGRFDSTEPVVVTVNDTIPPTLVEDRTPAEGTTGDLLELTVQASDNWMVDRVTLEYARGDVGDNATMSMEDVDHGSSVWTFAIELPADSIEPVDYRYHIRDGAGNIVTSSWRQVMVRDDDAPVLGPLNAPSKAEPQTVIAVNASVKDNMGIARARIEYRVDVGQPGTVDIQGPFGEVLESEVPVPEGRGDLHVTMVVEDAAGNEASVSVVVPFSDDDPPLLLDLTIPANATTGDPVTITWNVWDASDVLRTWVEYVFGEGREPTDFRHRNAADAYGGNITIEVSNFSSEPLYVRVGALDRYGNTNETDLVRVEVVDDEAPSVSLIRKTAEDHQYWRSVVMDASGSTDNIGITRYEWSYGPADGSDLQSIDVNGSRVSLEIDRPGKYIFHLTVYDAAGNSNATALDIKVLEEEPEPVPFATWLLYLGVVVVVVLVVTMVFLDMRKRSRPPPSGET